MPFNRNNNYADSYYSKSSLSSNNHHNVSNKSRTSNKYNSLHRLKHNSRLIEGTREKLLNLLQKLQQDETINCDDYTTTTITGGGGGGGHAGCNGGAGDGRDEESDEMEEENVRRNLPSDYNHHHHECHHNSNPCMMKPPSMLSGGGVGSGSGIITSSCCHDKNSKVLQVLTIQRRKMQHKIDLLKRQLHLMTTKYLQMRRRAGNLLIDNAKNKRIAKDCVNKLQRQTLHMNHLNQEKNQLEKKLKEYEHYKIEIDNLHFELEKQTNELTNYTKQLQTNDNLLKIKCQQNEQMTVENNQLHAELSRLKLNETNLQLRIEKLLIEQNQLEKRLQDANKQQRNQNQINCDYRAGKERIKQLEFDYNRLNHLLLEESLAKKKYHDQLQKQFGNVKVIARLKDFNDETNDHIQNNVHSMEIKGSDKIFIPTIRQQQGQGQGQGQGQSSGAPQPSVQTTNTIPTASGIYTFNRVFPGNASQIEIFHEISDCLHDFTEGINTCLMSYGAKGSGKTFTMYGNRSKPGILIHLVDELMKIIKSLQTIWDIQLKISVLLVTDDSIVDLLAVNKHNNNSKGQTSSSGIRLLDDGRTVRLLDVIERDVKQESDIFSAIGDAHRNVKFINKDKKSGGSHDIVRMELIMRNILQPPQIRRSTLAFCDLASHDNVNDNRSLLALHRLFQSLQLKSTSPTTSSSLLSPPTTTATSNMLNSSSLPFRDSKLTHLLKPFFSNRSSRCYLILTLFGNAECFNKDLITLEFGKCAMFVSLGKPKVNQPVLIRSELFPVSVQTPAVTEISQYL